jgi:hypothetical protein
MAVRIASAGGTAFQEDEHPTYQDFRDSIEYITTMVGRNLSTAPVSPFEGEVYYDTISKSIMVYNGSVWLEYKGDLG